MASSEPGNKIGSEEEKYSTSEVFSDAKFVSEAAKAALRKEKIDKAEAADAAGDLLGAASQYAKLDDTKGVGQYVDKASDYLHEYQAKNKAQPTSAAAAAAAITAPSSKPDHETKKDDADSGGGFGGVAKLAGGFFK